MKTLTPKEKAFVEIFTSGEKVTAKAAAQEVGYRGHGAGSELMKKPHIKAAIEEAYGKKVNTFRVTQEQILERLWHEANEGKQGSARINALVWLGKHYGMWKTETDKESSGVTYNIVNYSSAPVQEKVIEEKVIEVEDSTPSNVKIARYN